MKYDESTAPSQENFEKWLIERGYDVERFNDNGDLYREYLIIPSTYNHSEEEECVMFGFGCDEIMKTQQEAKELEIKFKEWQKLHPYVKSQGFGVEAEQYYLFKKSIEEEHMWDID